MLEKLNRPIWVDSRYSQIFRRIIPAHLIEYEAALEGEKFDLQMEIDFINSLREHPRRKDGGWDMRYTRNKVCT